MQVMTATERHAGALSHSRFASSTASMTAASTVGNMDLKEPIASSYEIDIVIAGTKESEKEKRNCDRGTMQASTISNRQLDQVHSITLVVKVGKYISSRMTAVNAVTV
jgi:hypothetical protein